MRSPFTFCSFLLQCISLAKATVDYSQYVNPFIGSEGPTPGTAAGGGDIFVGAARPFGVVKFGLDTTAKNWSTMTLNGGWTPDGDVTAVTLMHEHGTGGPPKYGIIPQMPLTAVDGSVNILDNTTYCQPRVGKDSASVGYFRTELKNGVKIELSGSRHAGIVQYSFPALASKNILVDLSHYLPADENSQFYAGGKMELEQDGKAYSGWATFIGGWNNGAEFTVYFYGEFSETPQKARLFSGANTDPMPRYHTRSNGGTSQAVFGGSSQSISSGPMNDRIGSLFTWGPDDKAEISSRIGISFMSVEKARNYISAEIPSWNLNDTVKEAVDEWNKDVLSKIQVPTDQSANQTNLRLLYSSLYMVHLMPSDRTGENPLWESDEPYFDDFYTMWDIFRCTTSLYHLIQLENYEKMIRSLIDIYRFEGFMPDGRSGNWNGLVQGGSDADNVLADAYVKGLRGAINWTDGYAAMVKDAEVVPYNTFDPTDPSASTKEGRGALPDWLELGYLSVDRSTRSISRAVEYAFNDFAVSQVAAGEMPSDEQKYLKRSSQWKNMWSKDVTSLNFTGFLTPRLSNGEFNISGYDPLLCYDCEWASYTYEAVPWEYSFYVPHDVATLIEFMGGASTFERRLDTMFIPGLSKQNLGPNGAGITTLMNIGNQPDFGTPYLYNYINKQAKSVQKSRQLAHQYFKDAAYGVPGNSDAGAMNSWLIWQMMGIYPMVSQPIYLIESPWFPDMNVTINGNQTLRITAIDSSASNGSEEDDAAVENYYVQSVKINAEEWTKNWFSHEDIMNDGGTIEFILGSEMKNWETGEVPPSPGRISE